MEMTNSAGKRAWARIKDLLPLLVPILIFAVTVVILICSIRNAGAKRSEEEMRIAKDSIMRAAVSCYAIEGEYPDTFEYLRDNYGVVINEDKYLVDYFVFASNIMPEVTVIKR